ncbi:MAG: HRDC domain-containing protein, partial [Lachnospiraceae bacterium]|nr:HRDC domain-containing protein [Lachnospiraceae bacterium]
QKIQSLLPTIIAAVATFFAAILALMGIHYSMMKKQEERMYKNRLVFEKDNVIDESIAYVLRRDTDCNSIDVCIKNISDNFGFLCSIYRICGCDIYAIEDQLPYFPIAPKKSYIIKNISYKTGDDQLILIYKDIEGKHYYIHLRILSNHNFEIMRIDLCNMSFISERLKVTKRMEEKLKLKKSKKVITKSEAELEETVSVNKENTKPIHTKHVNGYEIIVNESGEDLTDMALLEKLKKERLTISRENRVKAYIIFNNQQLVAMATYKPIDYESFISIYGLGEGKYNLYGEQFIEIIKKHIS